jgi:hypothetical protein
MGFGFILLITGAICTVAFPAMCYLACRIMIPPGKIR